MSKELSMPCMRPTVYGSVQGLREISKGTGYMVGELQQEVPADNDSGYFGRK